MQWHSYSLGWLKQHTMDLYTYIKLFSSCMSMIDAAMVYMFAMFII